MIKLILNSGYVIEIQGTEEQFQRVLSLVQHGKGNLMGLPEEIFKRKIFINPNLIASITFESESEPEGDMNDKKRAGRPPKKDKND